MDSIEVALPPRTVQTAIALLLTDMDSEIAAVEALRAKTRDAKQTMLQDLVTSRTRLI